MVDLFFGLDVGLVLRSSVTYVELHDCCKNGIILLGFSPGRGETQLSVLINCQVAGYETGGPGPGAHFASH